MAMDYYISLFGDDSNSGSSQKQPWQSIDSVNATHYNLVIPCGFTQNQTFKGNLTLSDTDTDDASDKPITFSSYGDGRATIDASIGHGFFIQNRGGVQITNLNFVGTGARSEY